MGRAAYLDLERPSDRSKLQDAEAYGEATSGALMCLDEVQRAPEIFPVPRSVVEDKRRPGVIRRASDAFPMARNITAISLAGLLEPGEARDFPTTRQGMRAINPA